MARDALVVLQTAAALVLLVGSALLMRSFWQLSRVDAGYDTKDIFTFRIAASRPDLNDRASMSRFQSTFMDRLKAIPGVESVGYITTLPLDEGLGSQSQRPESWRAAPKRPRSLRGAGGAYFQTMGIALRSGRFFDRIEEQQATPNGIISESAAARVVPWRGLIGSRAAPPPATPQWYGVIGVVEDVLVDDLRRRSPSRWCTCRPCLGRRRTSSVDRAEPLEPEVRAVIRDVIPTSPMYRIFTMKRLAGNAMASLSFTMLMVSIAALLALVLGAVGLYGVLSYGVAQRRGNRRPHGSGRQDERRPLDVRQAGRAGRPARCGRGSAGRGRLTR